jgi:hypothetical protein
MAYVLKEVIDEGGKQSPLPGEDSRGDGKLAPNEGRKTAGRRETDGTST